MRTIAIGLALVMIFMIPWEDAITISAVGSLTRVTGFALAGFWLLTVLVRGRVRKFRAFHLAVFLFVVWNVTSIFWTLGPEQTTYRIKTYAQLFIMALALWDLFDTPGAFKSGLQAYVLGGWVAVISTLSNWLSGREFRLYSGGRYSATGVNPGDLVLLLTLGLPIAWYLASVAGQGARGRAARLANYAYVPASLFAIALSGARMALFAVVPALLYILATTARLKLGMKALIFCSLIAGVVAVPTLLPESSLGRLSSTGSSIQEGDLGGRVVLWRASLVELSRHPLLGIGSGAFPAVAEAHAVVHNTFLSVLAELGIIGFGFFALVLLATLYNALRQPPEQARLWVAILLIWAIGVFAQTWEQTKATWLFFGLVVVSANLPVPLRALRGEMAGLAPLRSGPSAPAGREVVGTGVAVEPGT
jgi:O-antigen ligase